MLKHSAVLPEIRDQTYSQSSTTIWEHYQTESLASDELHVTH